MPRRSGRATGWKVAVIVLALFLGISLLLNLGSLVGSMLNAPAGAAGRSSIPLEEITLENNDSHHKVLVVPVEGMIAESSFGGGVDMVRHIKDQLDLAAKDRRVRAVILKVNSPGGEVLASDNINRAIEGFQNETGKPVVAVMGSLAASGGYYVSAPCRWIVANELTITGSIGVIMQSFNYRGLMDKVGLRVEVFKSGKFKDMLSGTKKETEVTAEERQMVQGMVDETFARFKEVVATGRQAAHEANQSNSGDQGRALVENWTEYADGRILSGREAYERGFVDELGSFQTAVERALALTGIDSANVVQYQPIFSLGSLFRLMGESRAATVKVDWGLEPPRLQAGLLYFLSPTYVQ